MTLRSATVQTFALALHELATNALKYGALAPSGGHLAVRWEVAPGDGGPGSASTGGSRGSPCPMSTAAPMAAATAAS